MKKRIIETLFIIIVMIALILENSSSFEIFVTGILFLNYLALDELVNKQTRNKK